MRKGIRNLKKLMKIKESGVLLILIVIMLIPGIISENFFSAYNIIILFRSLAFLGLVALGESIVILTGEIDLSVGSVAGFSGIITGFALSHWNMPPVMAFSVGIIIGILCGFINGTIISKLKVSSLVVTLGTMGVFEGLTLVLTKGTAVMGLPESFFVLGQGKLFGLPLPIFILLGLFIILSFILKKTKIGMKLYSVGSNSEAAEIIGLKVNRIKTLAFIISSLFASIAGIIMVSRLGTAQPTIGAEWLMPSVAAVVIGGTALTGGEGTPFGTLIGATIMVVIENCIVIMGISPYWQKAVSGLVVVFAISLDAMRKIMRERSKLRNEKECVN